MFYDLGGGRAATEPAVSTEPRPPAAPTA
jgi:hypothetical protein